MMSSSLDLTIGVEIECLIECSDATLSHLNRGKAPEYLKKMINLKSVVVAGGNLNPLGLIEDWDRKAPSINEPYEIYIFAPSNCDNHNSITSNKRAGRNNTL